MLMSNDTKIIIKEIRYVARLTGNERGTHTEYKSGNSCQLLYKLSGEAVIRYGNKTVTEFTDCIRFLPGKGVFEQEPIYTADVLEKGESINVAFLTDSDVPREILVKRVQNPEAIKHLFEKLHRIWTRKNDGYFYQCVSVLYEIFAELEKQELNYLSPGGKDTLRPAIEYIDEHFLNESINCEELAKRCQISHTYLTKLFQKRYGSSPNQYITRKKLQYAADLLATGEYPIATVAELSGFSSPYYFSRVFKRVFGVPPSAWK